MAVKWPFMSHKFSRDFSYKIAKICKWKHLRFMTQLLEQYKLLTHWVTKKECLNLIFVKDIYFCKKGARNGRKMVIYGVTTRLGESDFI